MNKTVLAVFVLAVSQVSTAQVPQCAAGYQPYQTGRVTTASRTLVVPGTASGMFSGVVMKKGLEYKISASGSIRVGVFGETGTPPEGWEPQGAAGPGFPAPDAFTFSLIYRAGRSGPWKFAGPGPTTARLGQAEPDRAELFFAINDTGTNDNSGSFNVLVEEIAVNYQCREQTVQGGTVPGTNYNRASTGRASAGGRTTRPLSQPEAAPCAGKTADGQKQGFTFGEYCPGVNTTRPIPVEACTYDEARAEASGLVAFGCHLAEAK